MLKLSYCDVSKMSDEQILKLYKASDEARKAKADKIKNEPAKRLSIVAGDLARNAIAEELNISPDDIKFRTKGKGKPYVENQKIEFSISHSGTIVVCAISDTPVGIDIERIGDPNAKVAQKFFTEDERNYVFEKCALSRQRFFEIWTRKEAYVKKIGSGVSHFPEFSVMGDTSIVTHISDKYIVSIAK